MGLAVLAALLDFHVVSYGTIIMGILVGGGVGVYMARKVQMTSVPEMVALLNGLGGGASLLVAAANYLESQQLSSLGQFDPTVEWSGRLSSLSWLAPLP